ncbi:MAG: TadE/TadG family type IV pilus assembly protein [Bacillota bacterium]
MLKKEKGQAMVEFALVLPILLTLLCGIIDFGWIFGNQLMANNACREAARYTAVHYYDDATDNDRDIAYGIITNAAPTLSSPNVSLVKNGEKVEIAMNCDVAVLTPFLSVLMGDEYNVKAKTIMKLE